MDLSAIQTQLTNAYNLLYGASLITTYLPKALSAVANILSKDVSYSS
ncbi:MAG: hypothetical protein Q3972_00310 [Corynebacterium sp.]|nr:hypothetical protein [Corynebacterium sp.]